MSARWYRRHGTGWLLEVHAQPGARSNGIAGLHGERLKVRIASPAVDGRANEALVRYLAERLDVPRGTVHLIRGERSRDKSVVVDAADARPERLLEA